MRFIIEFHSFNFLKKGKFTQADNDDIAKATDGAFIENSKGLKMDCGAQPTGFAISGTSAAVVFELFVKGKEHYPNGISLIRGP